MAVSPKTPAEQYGYWFVWSFLTSSAGTIAAVSSAPVKLATARGRY
jgi:hypothetical protein